MTYGEHSYRVRVQWTGNRGTGTSSYREYGREHIIGAEGKPDIPGSSDAAFRGDAIAGTPRTCWSRQRRRAISCGTSTCAPTPASWCRVMSTTPSARCRTALERGRFTRIVLHPHVLIRAGDDRERAVQLHHAAHARCYIANSVSFPIDCEPVIEFASG